MHYDDEQVNRMIYDLQYLQIAKKGNASAFIGNLLRDGEELQALLYRYPLVRYEPLDYHYVLLKYLSAWNRELLIDLCSGYYTWRGLVVASWLTCLRPLDGCQGALHDALACAPPEYKWFIQLALAEVQGKPYWGDQSMQHSVQEFRELLNKATQPAFALRPAPTAPEIEQLKVERSKVLAAYRIGGHSAAKLALIGTLTQNRKVSN